MNMINFHGITSEKEKAISELEKTKPININEDKSM